MVLDEEADFDFESKIFSQDVIITVSTFKSS